MEAQAVQSKHVCFGSSGSSPMGCMLEALGALGTSHRSSSHAIAGTSLHLDALGNRTGELVFGDVFMLRGGGGGLDGSLDAARCTEIRAGHSGISSRAVTFQFGF